MCSIVSKSVREVKLILKLMTIITHLSQKVGGEQSQGVGRVPQL